MNSHHTPKSLLTLTISALLLLSCAGSPTGTATLEAVTPATASPTSPSTPTPSKRPTATARPVPTRTARPTRSSPCPTFWPTTDGPTTSRLVEAVIEMPPNVEEVLWSPAGAVLAMISDEGVFLTHGPAFLVQEVVRFPQPLLDFDIYPHLSWSPEGAYLAAHNREHLWVIDASNGQIAAEVPLPILEHCWNVFVGWDAQTLTYVDSDGLWELDFATKRRRFVFSSEHLLCRALRSPSGKLYALMTQPGCCVDGVLDLHVLDQQGNVLCTWPIENSWWGRVHMWLDDETIVWHERCGTGCTILGILDVPSCQETLFTGVGAVYDWRSAGDYAAVEFVGRDHQAYLMDREGRCLPLGGSPEPIVASCVETNELPCAFPYWSPYNPKFHMPLNWSPDEQQLLIVAWDAWDAPPPWTCDLGIATVPELSYTHLLSDTCYGEWSPDGQLLSFVALGEPVLDEEGRMVSTTARPVPYYGDAHLGVLDLASRRVLWTSPFPTDPKGRLPPRRDAHDRTYSGIWSPDSQYLLAEDGRGSLYLWRRGEKKPLLLYQGVAQEHTEIHSWAADSTAFYYNLGERGWIVRLRP